MNCSSQIAYKDSLNYGNKGLTESEKENEKKYAAWQPFSYASISQKTGWGYDIQFENLFIQFQAQDFLQPKVLDTFNPISISVSRKKSQLGYLCN